MENKRSGFIYNSRTAAGFARMRRLGFPQPLFRLEDKITRTVSAHYREVIIQILRDYAAAARNAGLLRKPLTQDGPEDDDNLDDLMDFFSEMGDEFDAEQAAINKAGLQAANGNVKALWERSDRELTEMFYRDLKEQMRAEQVEFLGRLSKDQGDVMNHIIMGFEVDKRELYNQTMEGILDRYLDNARERIQGQEDYFKRRFLQELDKYISGETDTLNIRSIVAALQGSAVHGSRFFARDQMSRLNKATTLAQFEMAGVKKVKWITAHDGRVRKTHKELDGRIFPVDALPPELDDYNCRCGLVPAEY